MVGLIPFKFSSVRDTKLATMALTHSSASSTENNVELCRIGEMAAKSAALEVLYLSEGRKSGSDYNDVLQRFTTVNLASVAKRLGLSQLIIVSNGTTSITDGMLSQALCALFAAVKLS